MKNRDYKVFVPDGYYHIYNRGVGKMEIFLDDDDPRFFLFRLKEYLYSPRLAPEETLQGGALLVAESHTPYARKMLPSGSFDLLGYCLMPNHFHLLIKQNTELEVRKLLAKVCTSYSKYFNKKYDRVGSLFQDAFKAVPVETDSQLLWLSAYIHNNPKIAGLVADLKVYQWSSYLDYIGLRNGTLCKKDSILQMVGSAEAYKKFVDDSFEKILQRKESAYLFLE